MSRSAAESPGPITYDEERVAVSVEALAADEAAYLRGWARAATTRPLAEHAAEVDAVARALLERSVLTGRQMRQVIRQCQKGTPNASNA